MIRALDAFAFSSALVACAASALAAAASRALGFAPQPALLALVFCGTVAVYCVDRVRDLTRDARTSPLRSAFVAAHRRELLGVAALCAGGALAAGMAADVRAVAVAGAVAALGFAHRRLKRFMWLKPFYLSSSWTAVCVGLPAVASAPPPGLARLSFVAGAVIGTVQANVILSNLRDAEGLAAHFGARRARRVAGLFLAGSLACALLGPAGTQPLAALPLAMAGAVAAFRPGERFGAWVVDGALLAGGLAAFASPWR
ncbi:MAG TPA: hypothetical protein VII78_04540 [Myxococcota bacterium]|jgi:4-hydroxybenzoate polyprenyltransferase